MQFFFSVGIPQGLFSSKSRALTELKEVYHEEITRTCRDMLEKMNANFSEQFQQTIHQRKWVSHARCNFRCMNILKQFVLAYMLIHQ